MWIWTGDTLCNTDHFTRIYINEQLNVIGLRVLSRGDYPSWLGEYESKEQARFVLSCMLQAMKENRNSFVMPTLQKAQIMLDKYLDNKRKQEGNNR